MDLIKVAEEAFATGKKFPEFRSGDTITVAYKIIEGSKVRRAKLYYLRKLTGKKARIAERRVITGE